MVLQSGDLFHVNRPSRRSMFEVVTSIRETCYGDKACQLETCGEVDLGFEPE